MKVSAPVCGQAWVLAGLELVFTGRRALQLYNVVSGLTLAAEPPDSDTWRRHTLDG